MNNHHLLQVSRKILLMLLMTTPVLSVAQDRSLFFLQEIVNYKYYPRSAGNGFRSTPDGEYYTIISQDGKRIEKYAYKTGEKVAVLFDKNTARDANIGRIDDYLISNDEKRIVLLTNRKPLYRRSAFYDAYYYEVRRNLVMPLNKTVGQIRIPTFSPNGRMMAYVIDNDIYVRKFDYDTEVRVTTDGKWNHLLNGITDWVYEEELYTINTLTWSEDSKYLTFLRTDESKVPLFGMTIFGKGNYPYSYDYKYPKAGEINSTTTIQHYSIENRNTVQLLSKETAQEELYIPRLEYHNGLLYAFTLNRNQNQFRIYQVNPDTHLSKLWLKHSDDKYIDTNNWVLQLQITPKGTYYVSDENGNPQIYLYATNGARLRQLTSGDEVTKVYGVAPSGEVFYQVAAPTPMDRQVRATELNGKTRIMSPEKGTSEATFSAGLNFYLLKHSSVDQLPRYTLHQSSNAKQISLLEDNAELAKELKQKELLKKEFITLATKSGQTLNAWMVQPLNFDPNKRYPVVMIQYSGPGSQQVLNRFSLGWEQVLAQEGFIVVSVDGRGTGARGRDFLKCTYLKLGLLESQDQIEAAQALANLPYVDKDNIAIWGWSFGGYNVLMSMARGNGTFKAGIAVAPPTDWRLYDTIYTERYMRTPQENHSGYDASSVFSYVDGIKGKLLIVQGTADDNVHFQNTMLLVPHLVEHNIPYMMLIYPDKDHGIHGGNTSHHLYTQMINFLKMNLK